MHSPSASLLILALSLGTPLRSLAAPTAPTTSLALATGDNEYRLRLDQNTAWLEYFGPAGQPAWPVTQGGTWRPAHPGFSDLRGRVAGADFGPPDLKLVHHEELPASNHVRRLALHFQHQSQPLALRILLSAWADTGVFTREITITNTGAAPLTVEAIPSLAWRLPPGSYDLTYLQGGWGRERQVATEQLTAGRREFGSRRGRSTHGHSPWFVLHNERLGLRFAAQLAWSGNWSMSFDRTLSHRPAAEEDLAVELGLHFDGGGPLVLPPGASFTLPAVAFTVSEGDLDDSVNRLHRYQSQFVLPRAKTNRPPLVQFNSWYPFPGKMTVTEMKRCADVAASLGAEVFVLDAGWYNKKDWSREVGDWQVDPVAFPNGLEELAKHCHDRGLQFGLWFEIENAGLDSRLARDHPDWLLTSHGQPIQNQTRHQLNFAKPEVRQWARGVLDGFIRRTHLDWVKIDYNIDIGDRFDSDAPDRRGDTHWRHIAGYYQWLDELRAAWPDLIIENCSSGGLRFDLGLLRRTHTTWLSDEVLPVPSLQLAYGATLEFTPEVCNHWMVGEDHGGQVDLTQPPGWWDFLFRVPMNGQFGISSKVFEWSDALQARARDNIALYKRIRPVITGGADTFHLTPPPDHDRPTNWMAIQYVGPDRHRSVLLAYRLPLGAAQRTFKLRGLNPDQRYRVTADGRPRGTLLGSQLTRDGLAVTLEAEWRAAVLEFEATDRPHTLHLDGRRLGRTFEGLGALSAGASSRLLIDYPEPQRSEILDLLFSPKHGAGFQHLKVEIGGDVNSTDGTEPSHQRTRRDLNFRRGYEWWLMTEAKRRHPAMIFDCLQWGAPAWMGDGHFYSRDNAEFIARFIEGARKIHGIDIHYAGVWNETRYDTGWIKLLRQILNAHRLQRVKIVAADEINTWSIVDIMATDPELAQAIAVVGTHYPKHGSPPAAQALAKPIWANEDGPWKGTWEGAVALARLYNRNYIEGRLTKTIIWSPVTAYYDNLPLPGSGVMTANSPWSGHYQVQPALWATAHTTQFAEPGWSYLDGESCGLLPGGGSCVTLRHPNGRDYSVIIETVDVTAPQDLRLALAGDLSTAPLAVWRSNADRQFVQLPDAAPADGQVDLRLEGGSIYSVTTTRGQRRGGGAPPPAQPFPFPYREDFDRYAAGATPRYFSDQAGVFETANKKAGAGRSLRQVIDRKGIEWPLHLNPHPETFLGDIAWKDYAVSVDVRLEREGFVSLFGRVGKIPQSAALPEAYWLKLADTGSWELGNAKVPLCSGRANFHPGEWHRLGLRFRGDRITVLFDHQAVGTVTNRAGATGMVGLGSGWHGAEFDNLVVEPDFPTVE